MAITDIKNGVTRMQDGETLNRILRQLRPLQGVKVVRSTSAGTVKVTSTSQSGNVHEVLWGLQKGRGGPWIVRFDSKLIMPMKGS